MITFQGEFNWKRTKFLLVMVQCAGNIQRYLFDNSIAVTDPVYPVYVDTNVMAGRSGELEKTENGVKLPIFLYVRKQLVPELPKTRLI